MKYKNFFLRAVNLLLILGILWQYQQVALDRKSVRVGKECRSRWSPYH